MWEGDDAREREARFRSTKQALDLVDECSRECVTVRLFKALSTIMLLVITLYLGAVYTDNAPAFNSIENRKTCVAMTIL